MKPRQPVEDVVECWDDDEDLQGIDDLNFQNTSSTAISLSQPNRRDSLSSSRMSTRSDRESVGGGDEEWQVLLPTDDEKSTADAICSAKSAGIPIPQNVPTSALVGGTIKRLGGRKLKKVLGDDWGDDIEIPKPQDGGLQLKKNDGKDLPDTLRLFSAEFPISLSPSKGPSGPSFMERMASVAKTKPRHASLDKFRDNEDDDAFFGDVPTIKIAKNRSAMDSINFISPATKVSKDTENIEDDLELPANGMPLKLSTRTETPKTPASQLNDELDMEWAEGSLGTRFGGTRRDNRSNPSSSISAFSPSASSCLTAESEDDGLEGLILPDPSFKFEEALRKRLENTSPVLLEQPAENPAQKSTAKKDALIKDDFFSGIEIGDGQVFDSSKLTLNRNIKHKATRQISPARRTAMTLTFTNKTEPGTSKIPRPQGQDRPRSTLESVSESGGPVPHYRRPGSRMGGHSAQSSLSAIPTPSTPSSSHTAAPSTPSRRGLATKSSRDNMRPAPSTNSSQYLKAQRSMPLMGRTQPSPVRNQSSYQRPPSRGGDYGSRQPPPPRPKTPVDRSGAESSLGNARKPPVPFLPAGTSHAQSHHISIKSSRHFNRPNSSDSNENAPINRPISRLSNNFPRPTAPTSRKDHAPESLTREAASKRTLTKPTRRRAFGDGNELEVFDDLPTSATTESKFTKQPIARGAPKSLQMRSKLGLQHTIPSSSSINEQQPPQTPFTPLSPLKHDPTPRFARDTNASRLGREQRIGSVNAALHATPSLPPIRETGGPLSSMSTNLKAPQMSQKNLSSPMSHKKKRAKAPPLKPRLIKPMGQGINSAKTLKGMSYNPERFCWEGNENALEYFEEPAPALASPKSPGGGKREPALIANVGHSKGVQVHGGMVFDPQNMRWLKMAPSSNIRSGGSDSNPMSPETIDDDEDPFAGLEDLEDVKERNMRSERFDGLGVSGMTSTAGLADDEPLMSEEFDVGPEFIRRQRAEEERWRGKVDGWVGEGVLRDMGSGSEGWRWSIRGKAMADLGAEGCLTEKGKMG